MSKTRILCLSKEFDLEEEIIKENHIEIVTSVLRLPTIYDFDIFLVDNSLIDDYYTGKQLNEKRHEIEKLLKSGGHLFVYSIESKRFSSGSSSVSSVDWLPIYISLEAKSGHTIKQIHPCIEKLFKEFKFCWKAYFSRIPENSTKLALNRADDVISIVNFYEEGYIFLLPAPDEEKSEEGEVAKYLIKNYSEIIRILKEGKKEEIEEEEVKPEWLENILSEEEKELLDEYQKIEEKIGKITFFKRLLYQTGKGLENVVRKALLEIGIEAKKIGEGTVPDLEATLGEGLTGIIEIKGVRGKINLDHLRQLLQYYMDKKEIEKQNVKGILIANYEIDKNPEERSEEAFSKDAIDLAENYGFCLITTTDLYNALIKLWNDDTLGEKIKNNIKQKVGICSLLE